MIKIFPIAQSHVDWKSYLQITNEVLGRSPTAAADSIWLHPTFGLDYFLTTLKEIEQAGTPPKGLAGSLLNHVQVTLGLITTKSLTMTLMAKTGLYFTPVPSKSEDVYLSVISGTLSQWRTAILNCCVDGVSTDVRQFGKLILEGFENMGLATFMLDSKKVQMADGTLRLR